MMINSSSLSILLVTEDQEFYLRCREELWERFDIEVCRFSERDLKESLCILKPFLIIWDSRTQAVNWQHVVFWLRDHFSGRPMIAIVQGDDEELQKTLHRMGIHILLDIDSSSFLKSLQVHVFAILLDLENGKHPVKEYSYS